MKQQILKELETVHHLHRTRFVKKNQQMANWIQEAYPNVPLNIAIDSLIKGTDPYCVICRSPLKNLGKTTCSIECRSKLNAQKMSEITAKRKKTLLEKYGVDSPAKLCSVQEKRLNTMISKYGSKVSDVSRSAIQSRTDNLNKKGKQTLRQKYGVDNPGQLNDHANKVRSTMIQKYGVDHYSKTDQFKQQQEKKTVARWNQIFPCSIQLLSVETNLEKQKIFENPNQQIEFRCTQCGNQETAPSETVKWRIRKTGTACKICSGISSGSEKQNQIDRFIQSLGVQTLSNHVLSNNKQIDILCPQYSIGFEFNGLFWHNDTRVNKTYHLDKTNTAATEQIRLIHIFEDEWDHKKPIVESRIRNLLKKNINKIGARSCVIAPVGSSEQRSFFEENHIQGYAPASIAYGLYSNHQLVSLISFSKLSRSKGHRSIDGHWELLRFASVLNTSVLGAANKLLQHFIKIHDPKQILSFADKRWSVGDLYQKLGFIRLADTAINYWYINLKDSKRIHRFALRKNSTDDQSLTEYENRSNQGYLRIWDCGSSKWVWARPETL